MGISALICANVVVIYIHYCFCTISTNANINWDAKKVFTINVCYHAVTVKIFDNQRRFLMISWCWYQINTVKTKSPATSVSRVLQTSYIFVDKFLIQLVTLALADGSACFFHWHFIQYAFSIVCNAVRVYKSLRYCVYFFNWCNIITYSLKYIIGIFILKSYNNFWLLKNSCVFLKY